MQYAITLIKIMVPASNLKRRQLFAIASSLLLAICTFTMVCNIVLPRDENENKISVSVRRNTRMLAAELPFKDKLAPKKICSDMMILSSLITDYDKKDSIMLSESLPVNLVLETYAVYTQTDTQAMIVVCEEKKYAAVVFRGTKGDSLRDWQVNMSYKKVHFDLTGAPSDVMVHEGYWNAAVVGIGQSEGFENTLLDLMTKYDLDMIYVTGYSMVSIKPALFSFPYY